jgi:hypothetical protein
MTLLVSTFDIGNAARKLEPIHAMAKRALRGGIEEGRGLGHPKSN